ncbi:MAG TPA: MFS transporter [Rhodanobacter sp.]|nr:MFS transporter [Rhodanobacter sp.]
MRTILANLGWRVDALDVVETSVVATRDASVQPAVRATRWVFMVAGIGIAAWAPMVPYAKARLGLDDGALGLVLLAFGGGSMVSMPLVGLLTHHFGSRRMIVAGGMLACLALPLLALASSAAALAAALAYFGASFGALDVAMNAHAVEVERRAQRPLMSGFHGMFSIGGLVGAAGISGLLAGGLPLPAAAALAAALLLALLWRQRTALLRGIAAAERHAPFRLPHGVVWLLGVLCFISFLAEGSMLDWSALLLREVHGFGVAAAGTGYAVFSVAMALGRVTGDRVVARCGRVATVRSGACVAAGGFLLAAFAPWPAVVLAGFVLIGLGAANIVPVMFGAAGRVPGMPPSIALAMVTTLGYLGLLSGPALIGFVAHVSGLALALAGVAILLMVTAAAARVVRP